MQSVTSWYMYQRVPDPAPDTADGALFSETRALRYVEALAMEIGDRQVGSHGLEVATEYLKSAAEAIAAEAAAHRPDLRAEVYVERHSGAMTLSTFGHTFGNAYANITNVVLRIAPAGHGADVPGVLVNSHYDSALGSVGASDAATCIGVILEVARAVVADAGSTPAAPLVFLLNGGEETLMQAAHAFMRHSAHSAGLGAFINLESTGPWGPDVLFQSSRDWTLRAWADVAPYPRGNSVFQDFFDLGLIPADTDYRLFSYRQAGSLPGVDVAQVFDGLAYHTNQDVVARVRPGTLQSMGENTLAAVYEFGRHLASNDTPDISEHGGGYVAFDVLGLKMVVYSYSAARVLHQVPLVALIGLVVAATLMPRALPAAARSLSVVPVAEGFVRAALSVALAHALPALLGLVRALGTGAPLVWYGKYWAVYAIYLPVAVIGLGLPYVVAQRGRSAAWSQSIGSAVLYGALAAVLARNGVFAGYGFAMWAAATPLALALARPRSGGALSRTLAVLPVAAPVLVIVPVGTTALLHVVEKIGLAGAAPGLLGLVVGDVAVGGAAGAAVYACVGTLTPHIIAGLGRQWARVSLLSLLFVSVAACGFVTAAYGHEPYSIFAPKRMIAQHLFRFEHGAPLDSALGFVAFDGVPARFAAEKAVGSEPQPFCLEHWQWLYPLNRLVQGFWVPGAPPADPARTPRLETVADTPAPVPGPGLARLALRLDTVRAAMGTVNVTGDLHAWSFGEALEPVATATEADAHLTRIAATEGSAVWDWWVEAKEGTVLDVTVSLFYLGEMTPELDAVREALPEWVSPVTGTTYQLATRLVVGSAAAAA